jgi:hypothetical protein
MTKPLRPLDLARVDALLAGREDAITAYLRITEAADVLPFDGSDEAWSAFIAVLTELLGPDESRSIVWEMVREA